MDDKLFYPAFLIWLTSALLGLSATAAPLEYTYITPIERQNFVTQFEQAPPAAPSLDARIGDRDWSCDMYGMRTQMQVKPQTRLYHFHHQGKTWQNSGALPIGHYAIQNGVLTGENQKVRDQIKISDRGQLISQLTTASKPAVVLSYSICRPI